MLNIIVNRKNVSRSICFILIILAEIFLLPVNAAENEFPNEGDYITYKLTRKSLPDFITSTKITVTFHKPPFSVPLVGNETVLIMENEAYPDLFMVDFSADNWTLLFPEVKHDSSIFSWIIVLDKNSYEGFTGSSVYPVSSPFEEESLFPFLLNPQDVIDSTNPKEKHTGKLDNKVLIFWIIENSGVHSIIYVEETYGLLLYVIQEVYDPIFEMHDYSLELQACKLGDLVINEPIKNLEVIDIPDDSDPEPTGIPGFPSEAIFIGLIAVLLLMKTRKNI